ncbi:MAG: biotin carboxylase N-terminal domain-containing protein, partial [bacterium]|nr:biotin carboxylase N-terminal domain-containing protein [bacterium]
MPTRITRILIANRGEIASRVIRTARVLGISTVAVHSDPDASAPYVREADLSVRLPGAASSQTYLDGPLIIEAARASGADAIHPGYGFLSENADFARLVQKSGLIWIGPTPESIEAMALKVEAKRIAAAAGVPLVAGAELPLGQSDVEVLATCAAVGYPLLVKASAGGGGKGMHVVTTPADLLEALQSARREAKSSFGDDTIFVERYLAGARHVEVQVFGDVHGNVVHLFERECSIQRRHQKVIEEAPSPGVTQEVRVRLHAAAVSLASDIGYVGAGTVEFMVFGSGADQDFSFLEMNTRLQVEHPVTEEITGADLVMWQIAVASGLPLPLTQDQVVLRGHAIEARLYAEDPTNDYLPAMGAVHQFASETRRGLRLDAGVADGSVITPHYDPMLAKVISHAPTRELAAAILSDGLARMTLHLPVTNRDSLVAILRSDPFLEGNTTTSFLDDNADLLSPVLPVLDEQRHAIAVAYVIADLDSPGDPVPLAWRNVPASPQFVTLRRRGSTEFVSVLVDAARDGDRVRIARTDDVPYGGVFSASTVDVPTARVRVVRDLATVTAIVEVDAVAA